MLAREIHPRGQLLKGIITRRETLAQRPEGLHVSQITTDICKTMGWGRYTDADEDEGRDEGQKETFWAAGQMWEDYCIAGMQSRGIDIVRPAPRLCQAGYWLTPDGWVEDGRTIHEFKATWLNMPDDLSEDDPKFKKYLYQIMEYAHEWKAKRSVLHALFMVGNRNPPLPRPRHWVLEWDQRDLDRHHRLVVQHAKDRGWL